MEWIYSDGGRSKYFKKEKVGDCVCRAICNATGKDYKEVYDLLNGVSKNEKTGKRKKGVSSARNGVYKNTVKNVIEKELGWVWHSTMQIGSGCTTHLTPEELPKGTLIVSLSKHLTCVKDGVVYDTYNCSEKSYYDIWGEYQVNDRRCVYGYWTPPTKESLEAIKQEKAEKEQKEVAKKKTKALKERMRAEKEKVKGKYQPKIKTLEKQLEAALKQIDKKYEKLIQEI